MRRSPIRKLRFAPGKGNFRAFVLFNDGVDIWDIRDVNYATHLSLSVSLHIAFLACSY